MASNSFGRLFRLTSFGESHGEVIGGVIDGMPSCIDIDFDFVQEELNRRRPGQSSLSTSRNETDRVQFLSGIFEGKSTGAPIAFIVPNSNQNSSDYDSLKDIFRPSHADYTYFQKFGIRDYRGGGRSSARITIARVVAGALAKLALRHIGVSIQAYVSQVGKVCLSQHYSQLDLNKIETNSVRCPDEQVATEMQQLIKATKASGNSVGGVVTCVVKGCPIGLGNPEFAKLHAQLGAAMLSINAAKGFEYGTGFDSAAAYGSDMNDEWRCEAGEIGTRTNNSGGIQGGISNGEDIYFRVAFKPVATILQKQQTIDSEGNDVEFTATGRHDPCVVPRSVPIVEAMTAMVLLDNYLLNKATRM